VAALSGSENTLPSSDGNAGRRASIDEMERGAVPRARPSRPTSGVEATGRGAPRLTLCHARHNLRRQLCRRRGLHRRRHRSSTWHSPCLTLSETSSIDSVQSSRATRIAKTSHGYGTLAPNALAIHLLVTRGKRKAPANQWSGLRRTRRQASRTHSCCRAASTSRRSDKLFPCRR
jgi:hypothetical protein